VCACRLGWHGGGGGGAAAARPPGAPGYLLSLDALDLSPCIAHLGIM
jgi:hypothetical protein